MPVPQRITRLIEARKLEAIETEADTAVNLWCKAMASLKDSRMGLSPDNAITLAYQAALQAATAVLEAAGYRTRGAGPGHHHDTFYALAALGIGGLEQLDVESEAFRRRRTRSLYEAEVSNQADVDEMQAWLDRIMPHLHSALVERLPGHSASLSAAGLRK